jgi:hypothetical protein
LRSAEDVLNYDIRNWLGFTDAQLFSPCEPVVWVRRPHLTVSALITAIATSSRPKTGRPLDEERQISSAKHKKETQWALDAGLLGPTVSKAVRYRPSPVEKNLLRH